MDTIHQSSLIYEEHILTGHNDIEAVRIKIAKFLNTSSAEIAFTRNTTEGTNIIARSLNLKKGDEVILTHHEHISSAVPW